MTFNEALNILSLSPNYTEEELNSAYKKEAKLYHPDNYMNMDKQKQKWATMMMQKINKAREILKNHLKESKNTKCC